MERKIEQIENKIIANTEKRTTILSVSPTKIIRGENILATRGRAIALLGKRPLVIGGENSLSVTLPLLQPLFKQENLVGLDAKYSPDCCEESLQLLTEKVARHEADFVIGVGGGKALDTAKLVAHQSNLPIVTIPTSAATCAAWSALSNVYSPQGAFRYDVALNCCPDLLLLDYKLIQTAPKRTLVAGIGDAIAKWYEASISSGNSRDTLIIAAVQEARILRDILLQKAAIALQNPEGEDARAVVDANVLLAGVIGGLGGANCRTVAAHAVHNGLTQIPQAHHAIHGEKVAYGILVQLRLEEMVQENKLAASARQQLLKFYQEIGLPTTLEELGLKDITLAQLNQAVEFACLPQSDIHRLPFKVIPEQLISAMVSTSL